MISKNIVQKNQDRYKQKNLHRFMWNKCKLEQGSIMIEASIILPLVFIVILILITFSICVHDVYVSRSLIYILNESTYGNNLDEEVDLRLIGSNVTNIMTQSRQESNNEIANYKQIVDIPFLGEKIQVVRDREKLESRLKRIMVIEMTSDIIDEITLSRTDIDLYDQLLDKVVSGLEND